MNKTDFMVFRNGGIIKSNEKVFLNGIQISSSPYYKYPGVAVPSRLCWSLAQTVLSQQTEKAMYYLQNVQNGCVFSK